jgi:hypothetical protein
MHSIYNQISMATYSTSMRHLYRFFTQLTVSLSCIMTHAHSLASLKVEHTKVLNGSLNDNLCFSLMLVHWTQFRAIEVKIQGDTRVHSNYILYYSYFTFTVSVKQASSSGKASDLYSGGSLFESRPGNRLS